MTAVDLKPLNCSNIQDRFQVSQHTNLSEGHLLLGCNSFRCCCQTAKSRTLINQDLNPDELWRAGLGFKILLGGLGAVLLGVEWIAVVLTQPRKDEMDDYDYDNWFVNMLGGS